MSSITKLTFFEIPITDDHLAIAESFPNADVEEVVTAVQAFNARAGKLNEDIARPQEALQAEEIAFDLKKEFLYKTMMDVTANKELDIETRLAAKQEWIRAVRVAEDHFAESTQGYRDAIAKITRRAADLYVERAVFLDDCLDRLLAKRGENNEDNEEEDGEIKYPVTLGLRMYELTPSRLIGLFNHDSGKSALASHRLESAAFVDDLIHAMDALQDRHEAKRARTNKEDDQV
jgi:outer membrane murein-binding lipoprotein Lpp